MRVWHKFEVGCEGNISGCAVCAAHSVCHRCPSRRSGFWSAGRARWPYGHVVFAAWRLGACRPLGLGLGNDGCAGWLDHARVACPSIAGRASGGRGSGCRTRCSGGGRCGACAPDDADGRHCSHRDAAFGGGSDVAWTGRNAAAGWGADIRTGHRGRSRS